MIKELDIRLSLFSVKGFCMKKFLFLVLFVAIGAVMADGLQNSILVPVVSTPEKQFNQLAAQWQRAMPTRTAEVVSVACSAGLLARAIYLGLKQRLDDSTCEGCLTMGPIVFGVSTSYRSIVYFLTAAGALAGLNAYKSWCRREQWGQKEKTYFVNAKEFLNTHFQLDGAKLTNEAKNLLALVREG